MTKVFVDTSIFIRFLTQDNQPKFEECVKFFEQIDLGKLRPYVSNIVILEIQFVLIRLYNFPKSKVLADVDNLLGLRNLTLIEKTDTSKAISIYKKHNIKFADCLIVTQLPKDTKIITYDEDFSKFKLVEAITPSEL